MTISRRQLVQNGLAGTAVASAAGCDSLVSSLARQWSEAIPPAIQVAQAADIDPDFHLLSRATFGPWPGDLDRLKQQGRAAWIDEQLHPERLDDAACDLRAERFESLWFAPGDARDFRRGVIRDELIRHRFLRAVYSRRQLFELLVEFWTDHLNIDIGKGDCVSFKPSDDRDVIRRHALGSFPSLIRASATSPAMLIYLDGAANKIRRGQADRPNENYARELLELHTLGVSGGYTQQDVREAARCLSGWTFDPSRTFAFNQNEAFFRPEWHDDGEKVILGQRIPAGGGPTDIDRLVEIACGHPSTARHIAEKLCRRFVSPSPSESLVAGTASVFAAHRGDIRPVVEHILKSAEFAASRGLLLKRPFRFVVSALRALAADTHAQPPVLDYLQRMGQPLFQYPTPDGYPDDEAAWVGTLLWRWNFALAIAGDRLPTVRSSLGELARSIDRASPSGRSSFREWFAHFIGRAPTDQECDRFGRPEPPAGTIDRREWLGLIIASPAFQRC